ncbi:hypothetical protein [Brevibacillus fulvus]|uniref:SbsA Ig-like domain-containing protein n=1 Tax=Brevibacillus fulvus TaxID=1125967 RepID=A0A938Y1N6_9BACL|nr:hypothetical protein [Brevibacillus fulvus]MBM7591538.1 hypothetical protein [Brevibacillus fulvus]
MSLFIDDALSAINAQEIKVTFNKELDKTTAEDPDNYTLADASHPADVVLTADKKSVLLSVTAMANTNTYSVDVTGVLAADYAKLAEDYEGATQVFLDQKAPTLVNAEFLKGNLVLTFDEPVAETMSVKVDGVVVADADAGTTSIDPVDASEDLGDYTVTVALPTALQTAGTHTVTVYDAQDTVDTDPNTLSVFTKTFTITTDTVAPAVASVTAYTADTFKVKFSEELTTDTQLSDLITAGKVVIKKGNLTLPTVTAEKDATDKTNTTYKITVAGDTTNPLYGDGETSVALNVSIKGYQDKANLFGKDYSGSVTLTKDAGAPKVLSANLNKVVGKTITVKFDEVIAGADATKVKVYKNGVSLPVAGAAVIDDADDDTLQITITTTDGSDVDTDPDDLTAGTYSVALAAGAVWDADENKNAAVTTSATLDNASKYLTGVAIDNATEPNVISVNFGTEMNDDAKALSNYKLDGVELPAGTTIDFVGSKNVVNIYLPANKYVIDSQAKLSISTSLKAKNGLVVADGAATKAYEEIVDITDNIAPELKSAKFVVADEDATSSSAIELTFSEGLAEQDADADGILDDYTLLVDGVSVSVAGNNAVTVGDKTLVITTAETINTAQKVEVKLVAKGSKNQEINTTDDSALANKVVVGAPVEVSGKVVAPQLP